MGVEPAQQAPPASSLHEWIECIANMDTESAVAALYEILPGIETSLSYSGERTITHKDYKGTANLNRLGWIYLGFGRRCGNESAPFKTRLLHYEMHKTMQTLFKSSRDLIQSSKVTWLFNGFREFRIGCGHCIGVPAAVIPHADRIDQPLLFYEGLFKKIWGMGAKSLGETAWWDSRQGTMIRLKIASVEQVKDAMARGIDHTTGEPIE